MSDWISRDAVFEYLKSQLWIDGFVEVPADELIVAIRALPAVQPVTVRLVFANADATPKTTVLDVSAASVPDIMAWYGAYCSGDRYTVTVDGRNVPMDQNGEPAHVNETPKSEHDARDVLTPAAMGGE